MKRTTYLKKSLLRSATDFHGHLGPYLVLGLRMGVAALRTLQPSEPHDLSAIVWTGKFPPKSCLLDGIQFSSGCTLGNGNLQVKNASQVKARFRKGDHSILMKPTDGTAKLLLTVSGPTTEKAVRRLALSLSSMAEKELLVLKPDVTASVRAAAASR